MDLYRLFVCFAKYDLCLNSRMSEYIKLVSNVQTLDTNTISSFVTQLSSKLILEGKWEVAIVEVSYYKSWYNVQSDTEIQLIDESGVHVITDKRMVIQRGYYENENALVSEINKELESTKMVLPPKLSYSSINKVCSITAGSNAELKVYPEFDEEIKDILGFKNRNSKNDYYNVNEDIIVYVAFNGADMYRNNVFKGYHPVQLIGSHHSLYFYSNIVLPTFVGDTKAQLLKIVDVLDDKQFGQVCTINYQNPQYLPVLGSEIDNIEIEIRDDTGKLIPFMFGRVRIDLHLRKV